MRDYELTFILRTTLDEEAQASTVVRVNSLIGVGGGTVNEVHGWGRRHLAYPIEHQRDGFYVTTRFTIPPESVLTFENDLRLNENILRHLLVRQDEVPLRPLAPTVAAVTSSAAPTAGASRAGDRQPLDLDLDDSIDPDLIPDAEE